MGRYVACWRVVRAHAWKCERRPGYSKEKAPIAPRQLSCLLRAIRLLLCCVHLHQHWGTAVQRSSVQPPPFYGAFPPTMFCYISVLADTLLHFSSAWAITGMADWHIASIEITGLHQWLVLLISPAYDPGYQLSYRIEILRINILHDIACKYHTCNLLIVLPLALCVAVRMTCNAMYDLIAACTCTSIKVGAVVLLMYVCARRKRSRHTPYSPSFGIIFSMVFSKGTY